MITLIKAMIKLFFQGFERQKKNKIDSSIIGYYIWTNKSNNGCMTTKHWFHDLKTILVFH